jgi:hypothetical protein
MKSKKETKAEAEERLKEKKRHVFKTKAKREVARLLKRLEKGTLDENTLQLGLEALQGHVESIPNHDSNKK